MSGAFAPPASGSISGSQNLINVPFAYGDASPRLVYQVPAGQTKTVVTAQVVITQAFNGSASVLALGDMTQSDRLIASALIDTADAAEYETNPAIEYSAGSLILLSIAPGSGTTQGSGYVLLELV